MRIMCLGKQDYVFRKASEVPMRLFGTRVNVSKNEQVDDCVKNK
jgi:hypothetical protein